MRLPTDFRLFLYQVLNTAMLILPLWESDTIRVLVYTSHMTLRFPKTVSTNLLEIFRIQTILTSSNTSPAMMARSAVVTFWVNLLDSRPNNSLLDQSIFSSILLIKISSSVIS